VLQLRHSRLTIHQFAKLGEHLWLVLLEPTLDAHIRNELGQI
jgi:hypothetical protein